MEIILLEDIRNLGKTGEVVDVKDGYGRNFLLKLGKALRADKNNIDFDKLISKFNALENIIFMRDQTITGKAKSIQEVYVETSLKSVPNNEINNSDAIPLKKKNVIGIINDIKNTLLNFILISETSSLFLALLNSGNNMSRLAATS